MPEPLTGGSIYQQLTALRTELIILKTVLAMAVAHLSVGAPLDEATAVRWLQILEGRGGDDDT